MLMPAESNKLELELLHYSGVVNLDTFLTFLKSIWREIKIISLTVIVNST